MRTFLWGVGAAVVGGVLPQVLLASTLGGAMWVILALGLDQTTGVPVYLVALVGALAVYAAIIHLTIRLIGRRTAVPWSVWPGLAVVPVVWFVTATFADPVEGLESAVSIPAFVGTAVAFITLGKYRWTEVGS